MLGGHHWWFCALGLVVHLACVVVTGTWVGLVGDLVLEAATSGAEHALLLGCYCRDWTLDLFVIIRSWSRS